VLKIVLKNLWAVRALPRTLLTALPPHPLAGGACCSLPKNPTRLLAFGLDFRPSPTAFISPNAFRKGFDKNTRSAHFRRPRMHQNARFCIKLYKKKIRRSPPLDPRGRRADICSQPPRAHPPNVGALRFF